MRIRSTSDLPPGVATKPARLILLVLVIAPMPAPSYTWDAPARDFRGSSGAPVTTEQIRAALAPVQDAARAEIARASRQLVRGAIEIADWQLAMEKSIKTVQAIAGAAAAGGWANARPRDWAEVGRRVRAQYRHLRDFATELKDGLPLDGRVVARAQMYGNGMTTMEGVRRMNDIRAGGFDEERRVLNGANHCSECIDLADEDWQPAGTLPDIGDCLCLNNCQCTFERRDSATGATEDDEVTVIPPPPPAPPAPPTIAATRIPAPEVGRPVAGKPFGPSEAKSIPHPYTGETRADVLKQAKKVFGRPVSMKDLASAVGAPDGATVWVQSDPTSTDGLHLEIRGDGYNAVRTISRGAIDGKLVMNNEIFEVSPVLQGKGLGAAVFGRQVEQAARLGVDRIRTHAVRGEQMNGYYTWPRFGYDGPIPPQQKAQLPPSLRPADVLSDLMRTPEGRDWWKANGTSVYANFDLNAGSLSRRVFDGYLAEKASRAR